MNLAPASAGAFSGNRMNYEYPKSLYKVGKWDGVSAPDCVTVEDAEQEQAQAENGYFPIGTVFSDEPEKRKPGRPRKTEAE
jgi:hypothetical protein